MRTQQVLTNSCNVYHLKKEFISFATQRSKLKQNQNYCLWGGLWEKNSNFKPQASFVILIPRQNLILKNLRRICRNNKILLCWHPGDQRFNILNIFSAESSKNVLVVSPSFLIQIKQLAYNLLYLINLIYFFLPRNKIVKGVPLIRP